MTTTAPQAHRARITDEERESGDRALGATGRPDTDGPAADEMCPCALEGLDQCPLTVW